MKFTRKKKIALTAGVVAVAAVAAFLGTRKQAVGATAAIRLDSVIPLEFMPVDTPPALERVSGWPFQQLPMIAKFDVPAPTVVSMSVAMRPVDIVTMPVAPAPPQATDPVAPPVWLVPLAVGAGFGGGKASYDTEVPEPSTLILLSTGMAAAALARRRRRRK